MTSSLYVWLMVKDASPAMSEPPIDIDESSYSAVDRRQRNSYLRKFLPAMLAYGIVLIVVMALVDEDTAGARFWILLPLIPLAVAGSAYFRFVQRSDEFVQRTQLQAMSVGFAAAIFTSLGFGFFGIFGTIPEYSGFLIFGAAFLAWAATLALTHND